MGKAETKFANTAKKMDSALLRLLETTAFEKISVTMLCNEAQVNRSTFYAHYSDTSDLLVEVRWLALKDFSWRQSTHFIQFSYKPRASYRLYEIPRRK